ncbi:phosphate transport system permease protein [Companilactobacillus sp. RD055328]|uniref:phosphate ABC transporter permease subunit PstC n=1 Tax=Companilactobacillus sp. RD055328 TaxID=2916634 RepID=UPI001FC7C76A|nr:phosphate ABC transporter permease subunit PstC [Companilactobacillus sp. RD055328]GKQ43053.1 phosphate transport system permease protein [Companilactobacillus sp. RD055328]
MDNIKAKLTVKSKSSKREMNGKIISMFCTTIIVVLVISLIGFIASKGIAIFVVDKVNIFDFLTHSVWSADKTDSQGRPLLGALPMIVGSFGVTFLATIIATPFAVAAAIFMTEISPKLGNKVLQPVIELLVGIPSVVYGFIGVSVVVPLVRKMFGGSGFGILAGTFVLFVMILPTITSMSIDALKAVPRHYREAALAVGATRWQTISRVVLKAGAPGLFTAVVFGMARAFGEALAVQMVIGNAMLLPQNLISPASTLTSVLTMNMGNTVMGTTSNNALWSLALLLLLMSLLFNSLVKFIAKKGTL